MEDEYLALGIGKLEIEWQRNSIGKQDHSVLFTANDRTDIPHYYDDKNEKIVSKLAPGYRKSIKAIRQRLDLLGYTYNNLLTKLSEYFSGYPYDLDELNKLDNQKIIDLLTAVEIDKIDWVEHEGDADMGEFFSRRILTLPQFTSLKQYLAQHKDVDDYILEQIDPYIVLAALAHNPKNEHLYVEWRNAEPLGPGLSTYQKFLIVTEGKTDGQVIKKAIGILKPNLADFFEFIDMKENYPFGNAGSLASFFMGLCKIGTNRPIIFIFDNDAEGHGNLKKLDTIAHPANFKKFAMPNLPDFAGFKTVGPNGNAVQDVNQRAVAIEMYLDHTYSAQGDPIVRWSNFNYQAKEYQGALENKEKYYAKFMALTPASHAHYNFSRLEKFLDFLIAQIIS